MRARRYSLLPAGSSEKKIGGKDIITTAGVSSTLPASALLGWDVPELLDFVASGRNVTNTADALAVMTRLRRRQQQEALADASSNSTEPSQKASPTDPVPEDMDSDSVFNFDDSLFTPTGPPKTTLTRARKREDRRLYRRTNEEPGF